ncbi:flagellar basal body-associated FliL family protein [Croceicoccus mobilis]|uniref:Flagellar protein FliL n=1 Tax=Croceicoccus mobilis TaxID=1703339 RepID=A0A916YWR2_9SPHN|nr:flagellar basal body-associated FliL family protein [Croceicoccus mobilis]GGD64290.1 hypothetical protein GCM10010990_12180 [Croceicoccus mobilis]
MSKSEKDQPKPKKGGGMVVKIIGAIALMGAGGGGAFAAMQSGMIGASHEEVNDPKLVRKGEDDPYAAAEKEKDAVPIVYGDGGSEFRTAYYTFGEEFTSNLKNSDALVQVSLAASTQRDGRVLMWMKTHELAIRSAMLAVLADTEEEQVYSIEGKRALQERLAAAINEELTRREGFGGIDEVYFRSFIVQ